MILSKNIFHYAIVLFLCSPLVYSQKLLPELGICAHRGARYTHPENTLPAFKEALRQGVHMIEFDVWLSADNQLVVIHDPSVDRTTNGSGLISELTLKEIKNLDAGCWKDSTFYGIKVPTFEEVLEIMPKNIWLNVHIKKSKEAAQKVAEIIVEAGRVNQTVIAVKKNMVDVVKNISENLKICNMDRADTPRQYVNETISLKFDFIQLTERADTNLCELVKVLKESGVKINYYGTNSPEKLKNLFNAGVDYVLVDDTGQMIFTAGKLGITPVDYKLEE